MHFPRARQRFYEAIHQPEAQINLAEAALYIAQEEYPWIDTKHYLNTLDTMAAEVQKRLPSEPYPLRVIQTINHYLYGDLRFTGNTANYFDPRNSFLNDVIERRKGIPITLSLVYLEIARRLNFPMVGVGMPGHFMIRPDCEEMDIYIDPFNRGETLFIQDCQERLVQLYGPGVRLKPAFLEPAGPRHFLGRMLTNLKYIYLNQNLFHKSLDAVDRIRMMFPEVAPELRDRGLLCYQLGRWEEARRDLEEYLTNNPQAEDGHLVRQLLGHIDREI